jgi:hypothetical protein
MRPSEFLERIRQIQSQDRTAADVYADLAINLPDAIAREAFRALTLEEARHVAVEQEILALLQNDAPSIADGQADTPHGSQA